jgi:A/G-specific adenine glycosylase
MDSASSEVEAAFRRRLPAWFRGNRRDLPWRRDRTPYRVWISELMLQQTRVEQARPYFERWIRRFPDAATLASASRDEVLKAWEGLGYYRRAVHLHEAAKVIRDELGGRFPQTLEGLRVLPGVGPYTAAAIASLAFGVDAAVVDGNVIRVLARAFAVRGDVSRPAVRRRLQALADDLLPPGRAGDFNEAMMELGATVCIPSQPRCQACPLRAVCRARKEGRVHAYPAKRRRPPVPHRLVGAAVIVDRAGRLLIAQRKAESMLGGLWEFPGGGREPGETMEQCIAREIREELGLQIRVGPPLIVVPHAFSHFTMDLHAHWARVVRGRPRAIHCADFRWVGREELRRFAYGKADLAIVSRLEREPWPPAFTRAAARGPAPRGSRRSRNAGG